MEGQDEEKERRDEEKTTRSEDEQTRRRDEISDQAPTPPDEKRSRMIRIKTLTILVLWRRT